MTSHLERINHFERAAQTEVLKEIVRALETIYPRSYDETEGLPKEYQRYMRPHHLRTLSEIAFLTAARRYGLPCSTRFNASGDAHAIIVTDPFVMTISRTMMPNVPPRPQFRVLDGTYWLLPLERFTAEILEPWRTVRYQIDGDRFDCDDFALSFAAYARARGINAVSIVVASGAAHAFNIVALPDGRLLGIEPQGGEWVAEFAGLYDLHLAMVLI